MKITHCHRCNQEAHNPQAHVTFVDKPYKQTGWVGDKFIPFGSKRSVAKNVKLCGVCFYQEYIEHETMPHLVKELEQIRDAELSARGERMDTQTPDPTIFEHYSEQSTKAAETLFSCGCAPYVDIFTIRRWNQQGMRVKLNEHGKRIGRNNLFCRCQVWNPNEVQHEVMAVAAD